MKKYLFLIFILLIACNKEDVIDYSSPILNGEDKANVIGNNSVSKVKASEVSNLFFSNLLNNKQINESDTRLSEEVNNTKTIKTIETMYYEESQKPLMYIINYDGGGFTIISATKSFYPILAYSDNSTISIDNIRNINEGLTIWAEEVELAIKQSESLPEDVSSKIRNLWSAYETKEVDFSNTTQSFTPEQYMRFYQRMSELYTLCPGYSFGPLTSAQNFLSPEEYTVLLNRAISYGSPPECTIVGYKYKPVQEIGPLIGTEWHQDYPYNTLIPNQYLAGCVTIAMAQIMRFHQVPLNYNWNNMPNHNATIDTQTLIYNISQAAEVDYGSDGSSSNIDKAQDAFSSMGYNATKKDHDMQDVQYELLVRKRPVYMRGMRKVNLINWKGHAWVCEGARYIDRTVNYFVEYQLADSYSSLGGPSWQNPTSSSGWNSLYFYLNWGWGPNYGNGWFGSTDVNSVLGSYEYQRKNLYVYPR